METRASGGDDSSSLPLGAWWHVNCALAEGRV